MFRYESRKNLEQNRRWIMHEFTINPALLGDQCSHKALDFVLCRMKKNESENNLEKTFVSYDSIFGLQVSLTFDVAENKLECFMQFSELIQNLSEGCTTNSLEELHLQYNGISGPIHDLGAFSSLKVLYGGENRLNGTINKSLTHLFKLETFSLDGNSFTGVISKTFFSNMSNLQELF
ncbi:hypothetical protein WN943_027295 [Citrus x changshan-huyou]